MKSHSIEWTFNDLAVSAPRSRPAFRLHGLNRLVTRTFLAAAPALAIVLAAVWLAASPAWAVYLQATLWASGFVFFGLAIDAGGRAAIAALLSGVALLLLSYLSSSAAIEFAIIAAAIVAAWTATAVFRR